MSKDLSPYGEALLKQVGGSLGMVRPTPHAMKRWGMDRPDSIIHVLPEDFAKQVLKIPDEALELPEWRLEKELAEEENPVTRQDRRVRINFWQEYEQAHAQARKMNLTTVVQNTGLPSWQLYVDMLLTNHRRFAWLMHPPPGYELAMREAHELGMGRLVEILSLPLTKKDKNGNDVPNIGVGLLILQAVKLVDNRRMGTPTQKNVNVNVDAGKSPSGASLNMEEVDKKLAELEAFFDGKAGSRPSDHREVLDVESELSDEG